MSNDITAIVPGGNDVENDAPLQETPVQENVHWLVWLLTAALMGLVFGTAFSKSHVFEPFIIRDQFLFRRWIMLKMFLGAMGVGTLVISVASVVYPKRFDAARASWAKPTLTRSWLTGPVAGCAVLGAGMATAGACPGMVLSQVGYGVPLSGITWLGGLFGALSFGLAHPSMSAGLIQKGPRGPQAVYADRQFGRPFWQLSSALGVGCIAFAVVLEVLFPFRSELPLRLLAGQDTCSYVLDCPAWPPSAAGALLGLMQFPAVALLNTFLGSATSYQVCSCLWLNVAGESVRSKFTYMSNFFRFNRGTWWQLPYVFMAVIASNLWGLAISDWGAAVGVDAASAFLGGWLMVFGSRWAGGCTSGHGISGCGILMIESFAAVPAMFGGGIVTALIWNAVGGYVGGGGYLAMP